MVPPTAAKLSEMMDGFALSRWQLVESFDKATECNGALKARQQTDSSSNPKLWDWNEAKYIATGEPRLANRPLAFQI